MVAPYPQQVFEIVRFGLRIAHRGGFRPIGPGLHPVGLLPLAGLIGRRSGPLKSTSHSRQFER